LLPVKIDKHLDRPVIWFDGTQRIANRAKTSFQRPDEAAEQRVAGKDEARVGGTAEGFSAWHLELSATSGRHWLL